MSALNALAAAPCGANATYGERLHLVHVLIIEPHPAAEPSPYNGEVWEVESSDFGQATAYAERVATARLLAKNIESGQLALIDDLDHDGLINPVWCTYGPAPNPAFLISQHGRVVASQQWADIDEMKLSVDRLLPS
ncbi:MAG: hypothetical protein ACR2OD_03325 [Gaiellaceae bacterium]